MANWFWRRKRMGLPSYEEQAEQLRAMDIQFLNKIRKEITSDGSTASYYELPPDSQELQDLISAKNMNAQIGEIFRECYRYGQASHSDELRGIKKILFYANAELKRLENQDAR